MKASDSNPIIFSAPGNPRVSSVHETHENDEYPALWVSQKVANGRPGTKKLYETDFLSFKLASHLVSKKMKTSTKYRMYSRRLYNYATFLPSVSLLIQSTVTHLGHKHVGKATEKGQGANDWKMQNIETYAIGGLWDSEVHTLRLVANGNIGLCRLAPLPYDAGRSPACSTLLANQ